MMRPVRIIKGVSVLSVIFLTIYLARSLLNDRGHRKQYVGPKRFERRFHGEFSGNDPKFNKNSAAGRHIENKKLHGTNITGNKHQNGPVDATQLQRQKDEQENKERYAMERGNVLQGLDTDTYLHKFHETERTYRNRKSSEPEPEAVSYPPLLFGNKGAGLLGEKVIIDSRTLTEIERQRYEEGYKLHNFNLFVSDMISVDRPLKDTRNPLCLSQIYPNDLPDTSVIMCFLNEAWSVLVRSVHSVINTSPPHLLREIILVDDHSDYDYLKEPLDNYMKRFPKVKILRNRKREGLVRSRLAGALQARGKVLTFLDSHIECLAGWLPPLLARIGENSSHVVCPEIPVIDQDTFEAKLKHHTDKFAVGAFDWNLQFCWDLFTPNAEDGRTSVISPLKSPTMAGGLFSIDRDYFYKIGSYDAGMDFWGAENLEISFRIWMCGGTLEIIPCSDVFHIFRRTNPNATPTNEKSIIKNTLRMANVWMDDYKDIYFRYKHKRNTRRSYGDIGLRLELRKALKCHNFAWYIDNVYPTIFLPSRALFKGNVRSVGDPTQCLTAQNKKNAIVYMYSCELFSQQVFYQTINDELRQMLLCVDVGGDNLFMYPCHHSRGNQELQYRQDGTFYHPSSKRCISWIPSADHVLLEKCDGDDDFQKWKWETLRENIQ